MLQEGDIIELREGYRIYATVPEHFIYRNRKGSFKPTHSEVVIHGELSYLSGRYVVYKTSYDGGGTGHGPHDVYPNGHHVFAERLDNASIKVDFYQSGCFTAMLPDLKAVGKAARKWAEV